MKFQASDKTSSYGIKPYIKKGYYPAKLLNIEFFKDSDGKLKEGKYGHQVILEFAIYKPDPETGVPIEPLFYVPDKESPKVTANVIISKFAYYEYKNKKTGEYQTAFTPNSKITKIFKALGWVFTAEGLEGEDFIGKWAEVNVDDYEQTDADDETYTASTIKDIGPYKGPEIPKGLPDVELKKPEKVEKQIKHEAINEDPEKQKEIDGIRSKIEELKRLNKEGLVTDEGLKQAVEQLETKIEEIQKK